MASVYTDWAGTSSTISTSSTTDGCWPQWNVTYSTSSNTAATTATANTVTTWIVWNSSTTSSTTDTVTLTGDTWTAWSGQVIRPQQILTPPRVSEEERKRREEEGAKWRKVQAEAAAKKQAAAERAEKLLESVLTPEQREDYKKKGCFYLHTNGKKYRVDRGWSGNVKLVDETDQILASYCIHPRDSKVPVADNLVAQKLLLEANEEEFRRVANETRYRGR